VTQRERSQRVLAALGGALHEPPRYPRAPVALLGWRVWVALGEHLGPDLFAPTLTWVGDWVLLGWVGEDTGVLVRVARHGITAVGWPGCPPTGAWVSPEDPPPEVLEVLRGFLGGLSRVSCPRCHHPWGWHGGPGGCDGEAAPVAGEIAAGPCGCRDFHGTVLLSARSDRAGSFSGSGLGVV
jgi:hypothetical protein